jgi:hypothetical protein
MFGSLLLLSKKKMHTHIPRRSGNERQREKEARKKVKMLAQDSVRAPKKKNIGFND